MDYPLFPSTHIRNIDMNTPNYIVTEYDKTQRDVNIGVLFGFSLCVIIFTTYLVVVS